MLLLDVGRGVFECYDDTELPTLGNFLCSHTLMVCSNSVYLNACVLVDGTIVVPM